MSNRKRSSLFERNRATLVNKYGCCERCGRRIGLEAHHKIPVVKGGTDDIDNLELLCDVCHGEITEKTKSELVKIGIASAHLSPDFPLFSWLDFQVAFCEMIRDCEYVDREDVLDIIDNLPERGRIEHDKFTRARAWYALNLQKYPAFLCMEGEV